MPSGYVAVFYFLLPLASHLSVAQNEEMRLLIKPSGAVQQHKAVDDNLFLSCHPPSDKSQQTLNLHWTFAGVRIVNDNRKYTEDIEGGGQGLFIKSIRRDDDGDYECSATVDGVPLKSGMQLKTFVDITWRDTPSEQHPIAGTNATIKCDVHSEPMPTVDWHKSEQQYDPDDSTDERCKQVENGIRCTPITEEDNGQYTCRARVTETGRHQDRAINVTVYVVPTIQRVTETVETVEDSEAILRCEATGKPEPTYTWLDKNNADLTGQGGYDVDPEIGTLTITKVNKDDSGTLKCVAKNVAGETERSAQLSVIVKPRISQFNTNEVAASGDTVTLKCYVEADPRPKVEIQKVGSDSLYRSGKPIDEDRIRVFEDPDGVTTMQITDLQRADDGDYICVATNTGGTDEKMGHLTVQFAPDFLSTPHTNLTSWLYNVINITCLATSIPNATIEWTFPNKIIDKDPNFQLFDFGPLSSLQVLPIDGSYFGKYKCHARNSIGEGEHEINLNEAFAPGPLFQIAFDLVTANTITFKFLGPRSDGGLPVDGYAVRYIEDGQSWSDPVVKERQWRITGPFILEKLEPEKKYHFQFAASNKVGFGNWSEAKPIVMPTKSSPEEPTITRISEIEVSPYPDRYQLQWIAPANNGENITSFFITYEPVKNTTKGYTKLADFKSQNISYPGETSLCLNMLQSDTLYRIYVRALNSIGYSRPGVLVMRTAKAETNNDIELSRAGMPVGVTAAIIVVAVVFLIIIIDLICFFVKKCGIIMCVCVHVCNHPATKQANAEEGKLKESKQTKAHDVVYDQNDFDSKDASEDTPMIDGKADKEREALKDAMENDLNTKNKSPRGSKSSIAKDSAV